MAELECLPLGVGQNGEGICLQVRLGPYWLLLDCGLRDLSTLFTTVENLPWIAVLCSHAHPDHGRGLQELHAVVPDLPIYTSEATARLLPLTWPNRSLASVELCIPLPWRSPTQIQPNLFAKLLPAGHLPGAASLWLSYAAKDRNYTILYTGDFFLSNSRLVEGLPLDEFRGLSPDVLIIEGSFGTVRHPHRRHQESQLVIRINEAIALGKSVILPVPKIGTGQEILMLLRSHHQFTGQDLDIWVDAEVGLGCDLYLDLLPYLPTSVQNFAQHQPLFWDERVRPRVRRLSSDSNESQRQAVLSQQPCILLVDENAHWTSWLDAGAVKDWVILLPETLASKMPTWQYAMILSKRSARVQFQTYLLADHSDVSGTTQLIHNLKPQHVVFVHGDSNYLSDLANLDELRNRYHVHCPSVGTRLELPVDESIHAVKEISDPNAIGSYEGELAELESAVMLTLPWEITTDSRWLDFSDTGIIEARWQGEDLIIRGITQRELLTSEPAHSPSPNLRCCGNCRYYRGHRCTNPRSPLSSLKVSTEGYCPAFAFNLPDTE